VQFEQEATAAGERQPPGNAKCERGRERLRKTSVSKTASTAAAMDTRRRAARRDADPVLYLFHKFKFEIANFFIFARNKFKLIRSLVRFYQ
jgi:hypothetical protein